MKLDELRHPIDPAGIERLIRTDSPSRPRALAVIDGLLAGRVWADDLLRPSAALVIENADGTVYAGGALTRSVVVETLRGVETASGDLIFGFADAADPLRGLIPAEPYWSGEAIVFTDRAETEEDQREQPLEDGHRVLRLDVTTLPLTEWYEDTVRAFGSIERWTELGIGFGVMAGDELAAESTAGPRCRGLLEMGVVTREPFRRRGYGTLASLLVARACEARGDRVWWNANAGNEPSLRIARRIGFRRERRYDVVACHSFG